MPVTAAPFDENGNMQSYAGYGRELTEVPPFNATMQVIGMETGYSAKRLVLQDKNTGKTYPMFVVDAVKLLKGVDLVGTWGPTKRGENYGIKRVSK